MASRLLLMVTRLVSPRGRKHYKYFYSASVEYSLDVPTVQVMVTVQLEGLTLARGWQNLHFSDLPTLSSHCFIDPQISMYIFYQLSEYDVSSAEPSLFINHK